MKTILEPKLEREIFHPQSYGYGRPNRSVYDALREVQRMSEISLIIAGDLKLQDFSNLDPKILAQIFLKYIKPDHTFLKLFGKVCRAARAKKHLKEQAKLSLSGVILDGILYPLLANLYLTPFDKYVDKLNFTVSNNSLYRVPHVTYPNLQGSLRPHSAALSLEEKLRKISYVRFGDKFLVGIRGSYKDAVIIRNLLIDFLEKELGLTIKKASRAMNEDEVGSRISLVSKVETLCNYVEFLGYSIHVTDSGMFSNKFITGKGLNTSHAGATPSQVLIKLIVSKKVIKEWLINQGLANQEGKPKYVGKWLYLSDTEIFHKFKGILIYLLNYYKMSKNKRGLSEAVYIIKYSLLHTVAAKHRMSLNKALKKYATKDGYSLGNGKISIAFTNIFKPTVPQE
jgi:hypothetical protein